MADFPHRSLVWRPRLGEPLEFLDETWRQKTRIVGLPDGEEIMTLAFFVDTIPAGELDGRTDTLLLQRPALA